MKINPNSIIFKTLSLLLISSTIFILFISLSSEGIFSKGYLNVVDEKINGISNDLKPQISLNLSYGFDKAIDEIGANAIKNYPDLLALKIDSKDLNENLIYSKDDIDISNLKIKDNFLKISILKDPNTGENLGKLTIIYSDKLYKKFMNDFRIWYMAGIWLFLFLTFLLSYNLYKSLKRLKDLDDLLKTFNPSNPKKIDLKINSKDEIASISKSATTMVENIIKYLKNEKELNTKLSNNKKHLEEAQRLAHIGSWEFDINKKMLTLSDEIYRILGLKQSVKLTYKDIFDFIDKKDLHYTETIFKNAIKNGSRFDFKHNIITNKKTITLHTVGKVRSKANGSSKITAVSMDITQSEENKKIIEKLAYYDFLTQLPNRTLLKDRITKAIQYAKRDGDKLAVLFLDLDHFKIINDTLGHSVGDELLVYISKVLKSLIRESDTIARLGGDEFVIVLTNIYDIEDANEVCQKILKKLNGQHLIGSHQLYITTSIGVSIYPDNSKDMDELITNADTAMYDAKQDGRNNYKVYSNNMGNYLSQQMIIEQDLRESLNNNGVGLAVYYQPKIETKTDTISSAEALIRWIHPTKGMIFPDQFISVAESTGIIINLGKWIIQESIKNIVMFNKIDAKKIKIAINLSPRQFQDKELVPFVTSMLEKYSIKASQIEFEITESLSMSNLENTLRILNDFKNAGISIAIDDFGTGHSSLSYLKKFPINTLKIDQSFVFDMLEDDGDKTIVQTIISMAHTLGFSTVAEGVETKKHADLLKSMGCDQLQGYYFSRPINADSFIDFLKSHDTNKSLSNKQDLDIITN